MSLLGTVVRPPLPYIGGIPGGSLTNGFQIIIQGSVPYNADQFAFNLASGSAIGSARSDTALHFNPRLMQNCVVRNSYKNNAWGCEERNNGMPFYRNSKFEVVIYADLNCYKITVNNKHFCDYQHRQPMSHVNTLTVEGNVTVEVIKYVGLQSQPGFAGGFAPLPQSAIPAGMKYPPSMPMGPIINPMIPLTTPIPNGLHHGKMISISGTPRGTNRFTINLQEGTYPDCNVGLHLDVRFHFGSDTNVVVRNHRSGGNWGPEERDVPYFPFAPNASFEMLILCDANCFKIAANNQHLLEFRHRMTPISRFDMLNISGDVTIHQVRFQ